MRMILGFSALFFIIYNVIRIVISGLEASTNGTLTPYLIMLPGAMSVVLAVTYFGDEIYFGKLKLDYRKTLILSVSLYLLSLVLLAFGKLLTHQVNTLELLPSYILTFIWFPVSVYFVKRYNKPRKK